MQMQNAGLLIEAKALHNRDDGIAGVYVIELDRRNHHMGPMERVPFNYGEPGTKCLRSSPTIMTVIFSMSSTCNFQSHSNFSLATELHPGPRV